MSGDTPTPSSAASAAPSSASRAILLEARRVSGGIDALSAAAARGRQTGRAVCRPRRRRRSPARPAELRRAQPPDDRDASRLPSPSPPSAPLPPRRCGPSPPGRPGPGSTWRASAPATARQRRAREKRARAFDDTHSPQRWAPSPFERPCTPRCRVRMCGSAAQSPSRVSRVRIGSLARARAPPLLVFAQTRARRRARSGAARVRSPPCRRSGTAKGARPTSGPRGARRSAAAAAAVAVVGRPPGGRAPPADGAGRRGTQDRDSELTLSGAPQTTLLPRSTTTTFKKCRTKVHPVVLPGSASSRARPQARAKARADQQSCTTATTRSVPSGVRNRNCSSSSKRSAVRQPHPLGALGRCVSFESGWIDPSTIRLPAAGQMSW